MKKGFADIIFIFILILSAIIIFQNILKPAQAIIPDVYINEYGNLTNLSRPVNGTLSLGTGIEYLAVRVNITNITDYEAIVTPDEQYVLSYDHGNATHKGISEKLDVRRYLQNLTKIHNISNLFDAPVEIGMKIPLPNASECNYSHTRLNFIPDNMSVVNQTVYLNFTVGSYQNRLINVTCRTPNDFGILDFPQSEYIMRTDYTFTDAQIKILPDTKMSATKELIPNPTPDWNNESTLRNWTITFDLFNKGNVSINITKIRLWATPSDNITGNPLDNVLFEKNYSSCLYGDNILDGGENCEQNSWFFYLGVPVVWSEVFFENVYDFVHEGFYTLIGSFYQYLFGDYKVRLDNPQNNSVVDINYTVDFEYAVSNESDCLLYTNITGNFSSMGMRHEEVILEDSFEYNTTPYETYIVWNVLCYSTDGVNVKFSESNYSLHINALPRIYGDRFPDLNWSEDENLTINLMDYFYDLEDEDMNFTIYPSAILNISYEYSNVTKNITFSPDENWNGLRQMQVVATDIYGRNVSSNLVYLNVTPVPDAPVITWWNVSNATWSTTNETNLTFSENQTIKFEANATDPDFLNDPSLWFYWFLDDVLQKMGSFWEWGVGWFSSGEHNITLIVNGSDGLYDTQHWFVNITNINRNPYSDEIPKLMWKQNTTIIINLSEYFHDPDLEELNYSVFGSTPENITVNISNSTKLATLTPKINWNGTDYITFKAVDPYGASNISNNVTLIVYPYIVSALPNITFLEDQYNDSLFLTNHFNNHSYIKEDITWSINSSTYVNVALHLLTWQVNFTSQSNWYGNESILFIARHDDGYLDNMSLNVEVLPVNDPPILDDVEKTIIENTVPPVNLIDLWEHTIDVDNTYEELNYSIISNSNSSLLDCVIIDNRYINCTPPPENTWGKVYLNVSVSDGEYSDYGLMTITVYHYDVPPVITNWTASDEERTFKGIEGNYSLEFFEDTEFNFTVTVYDVENDNLDYHFIYDGTVIYSSGITDTAFSNQTVNLTKYFDFHSAGRHQLKFIVNQTSGDSIGLENSITWNLTILNKNRPPTMVDLIAPANSSFISGTPIFFNWTDSFDPDAPGHTSYDYWNISYILQIDDDENFYSINQEEVSHKSNITLTSISLTDGKYYWRIISTDGDDTVVSETFEFTLDMWYPKLQMKIDPNPAEYQHRDVTITWNATDIYLVDAYVNITYPSGIHLGTFRYSPIILLKQNLTELGDYDVVLHAYDSAGNIAQRHEILKIVNDTTPPEITLLSPIDKSKKKTTTTIFSYEYDDYATLENCTLYYQEIDQYLDMLGSVIFEKPTGNWIPRKFDADIDPGTNYFVVPDMQNGAYRWNVLCYDSSGNSGMAKKNFTFRIETKPKPKEYTEKLATIDSSETILESTPGFNLVMKIPRVYTIPGKEITLNFTIENTGESIIRDIGFVSTLEWISVDSEVDEIKPGQILEIPFTVRSPYTLGEFLYHIVAISRNVNVISPGVVTISGKGEEPPVYVIKEVVPFDNYYNITLSIINPLERNVRIYVEDYIDGMSEISFDEDDFYVNTVSPPALITKLAEINSDTVIEFGYVVGSLDFEKLDEPFVICDHETEVEMHVVLPHDNMMAFFTYFPIEYVLFGMCVLFFGMYFYIKYKKNKPSQR